MPAPDRIVRHLRLKAAAEAQVRAAVLGLEDALRCASLPDAGERLLLVRRLDLGRLPAGLSSQALSRLIEQRLRETGGTWVHGGQDAAAGADRVYFASRLDAARVALGRRAGGRALSAWYWPVALPGVAPLAPDAAFLSQLIDCLGAEPSAPAALPAMLADAVEQGALAWLTRHATPDAIRTLLAATRARGFPTADAAIAGDMADRGGLPGGRPAPPLASALAPDWLLAVLRAAHLPLPVRDMSRTAPPNRPVPTAIRPAASTTRPAERPGREEQHIADNGREDPVPEPATAPPLEPITVPRARRQDDTFQAPAAPDRGPHPAPPSALEATHADPARPGSESYPPLEQPPFDASLPTKAGGLLFLVNVLRRLGFPAWQARHAEAPLCGLLLIRALVRLDVEGDDPAWALAASLPRPDSDAPRLWQAPPLWSDPRIGLALPDRVAPSPEAMAALWLAACRRYLRRVARIGIASLCLRPARLDWSATHLDTALPLGGADIRVRREGLDIDPGWQDWLGRVVVFRYADDA